MIALFPALWCGKSLVQTTSSRSADKSGCDKIHPAFGPANERQNMKLTIDKEADALYLDLDETPAVESEEISPGVILDYNSEGKVTGIEPESAVADVDRSPKRPTDTGVRRGGRR